jgi:hypothetical protein
MRFTAWTLTALLFAAGAASASDDMTVVSKATRNGKPSGTTTTYLSGDHARMGESEGHETIIDLKAGTITTLDHNSKTYYTVTKKDMEEFNAKMREQMNSPEARKGMQAMQGMAAAMATSYEVKKTGETRKVAGFNCEEWAITMSTMSTMKECVTSEVKYPAQTYEAFRSFGESMRGSSPFAPIAKSGESLSEKMKAIKGFPVATSMTSDIMGNKTTTESEVVEISHASLPASTWDVPAGFTKIENPMARAFERHGGTHG